jgi:hypothetical protein
MRQRHGCYMDSTPSIIAANAAAPAGSEAGEILGPADVPPLARTWSSRRMQPDLFVSSAGQTTRLKFALCYVRRAAVCLRNRVPGK